MDRSKFSFNTANLSGPFAGKLAALEAAGFGSMTLWPADLFVHFEDPEATIASIRSSPVAVSAYQCVRDLEGAAPDVKRRKIALARQFMDQMALVGCDTLVLCSNVTEGVERNWAQAVDDVREIGEIGKTRNIRIAFEPICYGRWINNYITGWELVRDVDHSHVGLVLDTAHIFLPETPLGPIEQIPREKIFLVELNDFPGTTFDQRELLRNYRLFPGEGVRPVREFVDRVRATGYDGVVSLEVFNARYRAADPRFVAARGMQSLEMLFGSNV